VLHRVEYSYEDICGSVVSNIKHKRRETALSVVGSQLNLSRSVSQLTAVSELGVNNGLHASLHTV